MFTEEDFIKVHKLVIKFLKKRFEVYNNESVLLGITYDKKTGTWFIKPSFDQRSVGNATLIDFCGEPKELIYLEGSGKTPEEALKLLLKRLRLLSKEIK